MGTGAYDFEPEGNSSGFIKLKGKGDSVTIRIGSDPVYQTAVWKKVTDDMGNVKNEPVPQDKIQALDEDQLKKVKADKDKYSVRTEFTWKVINKDTGQAEFFTTQSILIYRKIKEYAQSDKWGDPTKYDLTITRTEESPANYYSVVPDPSKSEITAEEQELLDQLDLASLKPYAKPTSSSSENVQETPTDKVDAEEL